MTRWILGSLLLIAVAAFGQENQAARGGRRGGAGAANGEQAGGRAYVPPVGGASSLVATRRVLPRAASWGRTRNRSTLRRQAGIILSAPQYSTTCPYLLTT